jgi:hypothetical protein
VKSFNDIVDHRCYTNTLFGREKHVHRLPRLGSDRYTIVNSEATFRIFNILVMAPKGDKNHITSGRWRISFV